jgi:hypothetical protein
MAVATVIAIVSLLFAAVSFVVNFSIAHRAAVRARKPVLVFVDDREHQCWVLQNVGNGPALNIVVAMREFNTWFNPVLAPPLAKDGAIPLTWLGRANTGLGATYSDFEDRRYTATSGGEYSRTYEGDRLPKWDDEEVRAHWTLHPEQALTPPVWGKRASDFKALGR